MDTFEIVFGAQDRGTDEAGTVTMTSTNAVYHPGYSEITAMNDIAIIHLPKAVVQTSNNRILSKKNRFA